VACEWCERRVLVVNVSSIHHRNPPSSKTRAFNHPPKSHRGWQEVVRVAGAAWRRDGRGVEIDALAGGPCIVRHRGPKRPYRSSSSGSGIWGSDPSVQGPSKKSEGVAGGGARLRGGLASRLTRLLAAHVVLPACGTGDQNAPIAQVRAGPGFGGVTRAFKDPPKSRRGWQEVVCVSGAAWRRACWPPT
jgi:hypothetical protein